MLKDSELLEAIAKRHSVRTYQADPIPAKLRAAMQTEIERANEEDGLSFRIAYDEPRAFSTMMARYGKFSGVTNYVVCAGDPAETLQERIGYHGERVALAAQALGLNTCWVAFTFGKGAARNLVKPSEKLVCVIALGLGQTQGQARKTKPIFDLGSVADGSPMPDWFKTALSAAQLAPTAMNQQKFHFELLANNAVAATNLGGLYSKIDLGIARCHFELAANATKAEWHWA